MKNHLESSTQQEIRSLRLAVVALFSILIVVVSCGAISLSGSLTITELKLKSKRGTVNLTAEELEKLKRISSLVADNTKRLEMVERRRPVFATNNTSVVDATETITKIAIPNHIKGQWVCVVASGPDLTPAAGKAINVAIRIDGEAVVNAAYQSPGAGAVRFDLTTARIIQIPDRCRTLDVHVSATGSGFNAASKGTAVAIIPVYLN